MRAPGKGRPAAQRVVARCGQQYIAQNRAAGDWQPVILGGYPRPKAATPLYAPLVPAHRVCQAPNRTHAAPLSYQSCNPPTIASGVRIGTPAVTMRGLTEDDMREVGAIILETLDAAADLARLRERTRELLASRPLYPAFLHGYPAI